jgi:hypothetical protein
VRFSSFLIGDSGLRGVDMLVETPPRLIGRRVSASSMQLDHVAILHPMVGSDMLTIEPGSSPNARIAQSAHEVRMHSTGNVLDGLSVPKG